MYVGDYENWVFAQPAKDWFVRSYKTTFGDLQALGKMDLLRGLKEGLTDAWGAVCFWYFLDIETSERNLLELRNLTPGEMSPVSSRD